MGFVVFSSKYPGRLFVPRDRIVSVQTWDRGAMRVALDDGSTVDCDFTGLVEGLLIAERQLTEFGDDASVEIATAAFYLAPPNRS